MRSVAAGLGLGVALGLGLGAAAGAYEVFAVERDVAHGLLRLALERAGRTMAAGGALGLLAAACGIAASAAFGALLGRRLPRVEVLRVGLGSGLARRGRAIALMAATLIGVAGAAWGGAAVSARRAAAGRPNLLVIVMDTVRADRLSGFGYARPTTPELDAFAREAIRFPRFYAPAPWTLPSHASLFTGSFPARHGATQEHWSLVRRHATLAEVLRDAGYDTFAASANPIVGPVSQLDQGFARFREVWRESGKVFEGGPAAHPVNRSFAAFLRDADPERPFFAFLNYMDAHRPYTPPMEFLARFARARTSPLAAARVGSRVWTELYLDGPGPPSDVTLLSDLYDAELAFLSASIGALLDELRRDGRYDTTIIAITSDHGEHLGEHGLFDHVFSLYEPLLHVPLLLRLPGGAKAGTTDARAGQLTDLLPTLLAACGVRAPRLIVQGSDLLDPVRVPGPVLASYAYPHQALAMIGPDAVASHRDKLAPFLRSLRALRDGDTKLIEGSDGRIEVFDLAADPGELRNLAPSEAARRAALETRLAEAVAAGALPSGAAATHGVVRSGSEDHEREQALRALGYVE